MIVIKPKRRKLFKKLRLKTIFFLAITICSNTFAWFIYTTEVSSKIDTRVREWNVTFNVNGEHVEKVININVETLYPGMEEYSETLTASNNGEAKAKIEYEVKEANILGENLLDLGLSSEELIEYLKTNYPFKIELNSSNEFIDIKDEESVTIRVYWPYESGDDELDTLWGKKSYDYHKSNPDKPSLELSIKITAYQVNE